LTDTARRRRIFDEMRHAIVIALMVLGSIGGVWGAHALHQRAARIHIIDAGGGHTVVCTGTALSFTCRPGNTHEPAVDNAVAAALLALSIGLIVHAVRASRSALRH
jgi:hypothetical protein